MQDEQRLDIAEACRLVSASDSTIRRLIRDGKLKAQKQKVRGREKLLIGRRDLLAAFGTAEALSEGSGSIVKLPGRDRGHALGQTAAAPEQGELIKLLQTELGKREHELAGLRQETQALRAELTEERAEVRRLNAEFLGLLREGREQTGREPVGRRGLLKSFLERWT